MSFVYYIESKVLSPDGKRLALTFVADGKVVAVASGGLPVERQQWVLENITSDSQTTVVPALDKTLQAWQKTIDNINYVATIPPTDNVWTFKDTGDGWTISDAKQTVYWTIATARENSVVLLEPGSNDEKQRWLVEKVPPKGEHEHHHHREHHEHHEQP